MSQRPSVKWLVAKILYLVFFWIIAVFVVLYVAGFRINWTSGKLQGSSSVSFADWQKTKQTVNYTINGEERSGTLPLVLNWLSPGIYSVGISVDGYNPWYQSFRLQAGEAATFDSILLIPKELKPRAATDNEKATLNRVVRLVGNGLLIRDNELYDVRGEKEKLIVRMSHSIAQAIWYQNRTHILVRVDQTVYIMEITGTNITSLFTVQSTAPVPLAVSDGGASILVKDGDTFSAYTLF